MLWFLIFVASALFIYFVLYKPHKYWEEQNVPHVKPFPFLGNMARITFRRISFTEGIHELCQQFNTRYFGIYQFITPTLVVTDPDLIKQIGIKDFEHFIDHQVFIPPEIDPLFGKNLLQLRGHNWRHMRSILSPAFTSSKMRSMFVLMSECADHFTDNFIQTAESSKHITVEMNDIFTRFANDVIATCAFGIKCDSLADRDNVFYRMGKKITDFEGIKGLKFLVASISPFLIKLFRIRMVDLDTAAFFSKVIADTIQQREEKGIQRPDMIHLLMELRKGQLKHEESKDKDEDTGFATVEESHIGKEINITPTDISMEDLVAQALIFFFAGFDTVSIVLCFTAYELAIHPDIQQKLQEEIDETLKNCKDNKITYEAITKMKYLDMVISESLRKWPAAILTDRVCTKPYTIQPVDSSEKPLHLKKGDLIWIPFYSIHRNPNIYPNPDKFDPERFNDENKGNINSLTYIPFGIGPRNCIGSRFALLEAKVIFVYLLSKFDIVPDTKTQIPLKLSKTNFNLRCEKDFWVGLKSRNKKVR